jgi:hypothetical protein
MRDEGTLDYDPLSEIETDRTDDEAVNVLLVHQKRKELKRANTGLFVALIPCALSVILIIPAIIGIGLLRTMKENNRKIAALNRHGIDVLVNRQVDLDLAERLDGELSEEEIDGSLATGLDPDTPKYKLKAYEDG